MPYACDEISLYATYASRNHTPPRVRAFIDFIASALTARISSDVSLNGRRAALPAAVNPDRGAGAR